MRLIVFFDLPMKSKKEVRKYNLFRKWLTENGYIMMQYSIYCKIFNNRDACVKHMDILKRHVPNKGQVRIMMVTEKQYASIEVIVGGVSKQEEMTTVTPFVSL